jgi:hypothetical protein
MRQVILNIPEGKFDVFIQFIKNIPFVKICSEKKLSASSAKNRIFTIVKLKNKNFKFNRDEANER